MRFLLKWVLVMVGYGSVMVVIGPICLLTAEKYHQSLNAYLKANDVHIIFRDTIAAVPYIFLVFITIGIFVGLIILIEMIIPDRDKHPVDRGS